MAGLFGGSKPAPPPPPPPVVPMPDPEGPEVKEAQMQRARDILARGGRRSTILTDESDRTAGPYRRRTLGGS